MLFFKTKPIPIKKLDPGLLEGLFYRASHDGKRRAPAVLKILNRSQRNADLLRKLRLRPVKQAARGATLCRRNLHSPFIGKTTRKNNLTTTMLPNLRNISFLMTVLRNRSATEMHAQLAASLRHLKQALVHLHDAKLIIATIDKAAAQYLDVLVRATREQIKHLESLNEDRN